MAQHLKLIALLIFTLSASYTSAQSLRKLLERPYGIIESKWEKNAQGATELNYYNEDYCDYYLYRANDRSYNLSNGKNTIFKIEKNAQVDNPFKSASSYTFYRGKFPKDFNIQTPYALPVKNNQKTAWKTDPREPFKTLNFHIKQGDTIYATRSGIACKTTNPQQLLIYHPDQTFAAYLVMNEKGEVDTFHSAATNDFYFAAFDFTNPEMVEWYKGLVKNVVKDGVGVIKTDFSEALPLDAVYHDGSNGLQGHNKLPLLYAKTTALIRRSRGTEDGALVCGAIRLDTRGKTCTVSDIPVILSPKEYDLLLCLMRNRGRVFSRDQLLTRVWGWDFQVGDRAVDGQIKNLRASLGPAGRQIKTVFKAGYKLEEA